MHGARLSLRLALVAVLVAACQPYAEDCATYNVEAGTIVECTMPGYTDRAFDLHVPESWDGSSVLPVIVALHGGGGYKGAAETVSCPDGDRSDPRCLANVASARGYAIVYPNGLGSRPLRGVRTWNAGGGVNGYVCGFGNACKLGSDDVGYIEDVLDEVARALPIDTARVYATGISNGGAMSHRLGCEARARFAAIAPVAGANLFADSGGACDVTTPILNIHGTGDSRWRYEGGNIREGYWSGAEETMENWRVRNGCSEAFIDEAIGQSSTRRRWQGCTVATEHIRVDGGGHTWPSGHQYFSVDLIGPVNFDFGSEVIVDFFDAH